MNHRPLPVVATTAAAANTAAAVHAAATVHAAFTSAASASASAVAGGVALWRGRVHVRRESLELPLPRAARIGAMKRRPAEERAEAVAAPRRRERLDTLPR